MNWFALKQHTASSRPPAQLYRLGFNVFFEAGWEPMRRHKVVVRAFLTSDRRHIRLTKSGGGCDQRFEHRLQIERRAADDLEHVGSGGLLLGGLAGFVKQARVPYGDHRLRSEVLDQRDLLVGKWPHFLAVDDDRAD